jgi:hypothetical protein
MRSACLVAALVISTQGFAGTEDPLPAARAERALAAWAKGPPVASAVMLVVAFVLHQKRRKGRL